MSDICHRTYPSAGQLDIEPPFCECLCHFGVELHNTVPHQLILGDPFPHRYFDALDETLWHLAVAVGYLVLVAFIRPIMGAFVAI